MLVLSSAWLVVTGVAIIASFRYFLTSDSSGDGIAVLGHVIAVGASIVMAFLAIAGMLLGCLLIMAGKKMQGKLVGRKQVRVKSRPLQRKK